MASRDVQLIVCTNGDCRRAKGHRDVLAVAASVPGSMTVPCQGICSGPVVGVRRGDDVRWYRRLSPKALARLVHAGGRHKAVRKLEVRKRRGALRHPRRVKALV